MSRAVLIGGLSGSGKSTSMCSVPELSIKGLPPERTVIIASTDKDLPMRGSEKLYTDMVFEGKGDTLKWKSGNKYISNEPKKVLNVLRLISRDCKDIQYVVLDDWQYWLSDQYMDKVEESDWELFKKIGKDGYLLLKAAREMRDDLTVFVLAHIDVNERAGKTYMRIKTLGKLLDEKDTPIGRFTIVLEACRVYDKSDIKHQFRTKGIHYEDIVKAPIGMFKDTYIRNDLGLVVDLMESYYNNTK